MNFARGGPRAPSSPCALRRYSIFALVADAKARSPDAHDVGRPQTSRQAWTAKTAGTVDTDLPLDDDPDDRTVPLKRQATVMPRTLDQAEPVSLWEFLILAKSKNDGRKTSVAALGGFPAITLLQGIHGLRVLDALCISDICGRARGSVVKDKRVKRLNHASFFCPTVQLFVVFWRLVAPKSLAHEVLGNDELAILEYHLLREHDIKLRLQRSDRGDRLEFEPRSVPFQL